MKVVRESITKACIVVELSEEEADDLKTYLENCTADLGDYDEEVEIIDTAEDFAKKLVKALD